MIIQSSTMYLIVISLRNRDVIVLMASNSEVTAALRPSIDEHGHLSSPFRRIIRDYPELTKLYLDR